MDRDEVPPRPSIPPSQVTSRNAVNVLRLLLEEHGHVVDEIAGASDFGEDLHVSFGEGNARTGYVVAVQVKGGVSYRRGQGYQVPVEKHAANWSESNIPVACVVHDPEERSLFWANASKQLRHAKLTMQEIQAITVPHSSPLTAESLPAFVAEMRGYIDGTRDIANAIEELTGIAASPRDYIAYSPNIYGERMAFIQRFGTDHALLVHDDLEPHPIPITPDDLLLPGTDRHRQLVPHELLKRTPLLGEYILNPDEAMWLISCFANSQ